MKTFTTPAPIHPLHSTPPAQPQQAPALVTPPVVRKGFTLIELLVVITIIVVLLALLTPALDSAMEQAERTVCASRLDAWGVAVSQHFLDNRRKLLTVPLFGGAAAYPNHPFDRDRSGAEAGCISLDVISPYLGGPGGHVTYVLEPFYCPAQGTEDNRVNNDRIARQPEAEFLYSDYAYFAGVPRQASNASDPDHLVGRKFGSSRILMADTIYKWNGNIGGAPLWYFNHSEVGSANHVPGFNQDFTGVPPLTGTNQLFGDGSVKWKDGDLFDPQAMNSGNPADQKPEATGGYVTSDPGGNPAADINFY